MCCVCFVNKELLLQKKKIQIDGFDNLAKCSRDSGVFQSRSQLNSLPLHHQWHLQQLKSNQAHLPLPSGVIKFGH